MKKEQKYEDAVRELENIVGRIEKEEADINQIGKSLKRAQQLIRLCRAKLTKTEAEIKAILEEEQAK